MKRSVTQPPVGTSVAKEDPGIQSGQLSGRGSFESRKALGREARHRTPRSDLGQWAFRERDPVEILEASNKGRLTELVPIRYGRMLASPFPFYRGSAALMAGDLSTVPNSGVTVQLCGDAHLSNFGVFGSPERRMLFGLNDFDETLPGPFDWDVRRLAASFVIAARDRGFGEKVQRRAVTTLCETFRKRVAECAAMDTLSAWYQQLTADDLIALARSRGVRAREGEVFDKARKRDSRSVAVHGVELVNGRLRIRDAPPLIYHFRAKTRRAAAEFETTVRRFFAKYRLTLADDRRAFFDRFELVDMAVRVVGVGSVGTRCFVALFVADGETPLFLQVKEARASVMEPYVGASAFSNHGHRVVTGQRLMQSASDVFLGWSRSAPSGFDFYVRQLRDMKGAFDIATFTPSELDDYARACGLALATSMSKASDPAPILGYIGRSEAFDQAIESFAFAYADQNEADWEAFKAAVKAGRLQASEDL